MELADYPIRMGHRVEDKVTLRPTHGLAALTVKRVCRKCNNGWMSELEAWFLRRAGYLVEPTWPLLADAMIEQVQVEAERLACWGLKTAIMIDRSGISPKIPDSFASDLFKGNLPNSLRIDLATIKTTGLGCRNAPGFSVQNGDQPIAWQSRDDGLAFQTVLQLNHLGIRVFCAPNAEAAYIRPDLMIVRAYPPQKFSTTKNFAYDSLEQFRANLLLVAST
jgi:hypothetical protein